jgi:hypothetical protein
MNLEFSQKASIWIGIAVLVLIVGGFGIYSGLNNLKSASSELASSKDAYQSQQDRLEKLKAFQSKIDQAEEIIALMNEALPTQDHAASVVTLIESVAVKSGVQLSNISLGDTGEGSMSEASISEEEMMMDEDMMGGEVGLSSSSEPSLTTQSVDITLAGTYPQIKRFFSNLGKNRRPLSVESFQLSGEGASLSLTHYLLK